MKAFHDDAPSCEQPAVVQDNSRQFGRSHHVETSFCNENKDSHIDIDVDNTSPNVIPFSDIKIASVDELEFSENYRKYVPIKIKDKALSAFVDSGNTFSNCISLELLKELGLGLSDLTPVKNIKSIGTAKAGTRLPVLGRLKSPIKLRFGGHPTLFKTKPVVIQGLAMPFNISGPFLQQFGIDQIHSQSALKVQGRLVKMIGKNRNLQTISAIETFQSDAYVAETVTVPNNSAMFLSIRVPGVEDCQMTPGDGIIEGSCEFMDRTDLHPVLGAVTTVTPQGTAFVSVMNTLDKPVIIQRGTKYGAFTRLHEDLDEPGLVAQAGASSPTTTTPRKKRKKNQQESKVKESDLHRSASAANQQSSGLRRSQHDTSQQSSGLQRSKHDARQQSSGQQRSRKDDRQQSPDPHGSKSDAEKRQWLIDSFKLEHSPWLKRPCDLDQATDLLMDYLDIISEGDRYGKTDLIEHEIHTKDIPPIKMKNRPFNPVMEAKLKSQVDNWLSQGVIEPSTSPWSFRLVPVPKKNGKTRFCIDYRKLNEATLKDSYPLPNIEDNLARLSKSRVYSAIDGAGAFHTVSIRKQDRAKTAFSTPWGLFQFRQMPFGLCNAPATYSRLVQRVLEGIPPTIALAYLDDTCVHTADLSSHFDALKQVFQAHRLAGLTIQPSKCQLFQDKIDYLGHQVSADGIGVIPKYTEVIKDWPAPTTVNEVRVFMGKASYYRKFVENFAKVAAPLSNLIKKEDDVKGRTIALSKEAKTAFEILKDRLIHAPILAYPQFDSEEPFIVDTDWSQEVGAIGGVLSQKQDGKERVIAYGARKLSKAERNYPSNKGELLGVIHFLKQWKYYLQFRPFILRTDHHALKWITTMEEPTGMIARWLQTLGNYNFTVEFRKGSKHGNADSLSRIGHSRQPTPEEEAEALEELVAAIHLRCPASVPPETMKHAQRDDAVLKQVCQWKESNTKPPYEEIRKEGLEVRTYYSLFEVLELNDDGVLLRKGQPGESIEKSRICVPTSLQKRVIKECHVDGGHMGIRNTQQRTLARFYFPGLYKTVESVVSTCPECQKKAGRRPDQRHTLKSVQEGYPFRKISIDFVGPLRPSSRGNTYILTVKDVFTRWIEAFPTSKIDAHEVARLLESEIFGRYGMPEQVHSDQGSQFTSEMMEAVYKELGGYSTSTPAYNPKSNPVERTHKDLGAILRATTMETQQDWEDHLPSALLALRTARNRHTGVTPFFAMFGREATMPVDIIYGNTPDHKKGACQYANDLRDRLQACYAYVRTHLQQAVERARMQYKNQLQGEPLKPDDLVWLYTPRVHPGESKKLTSYWSGPWKIEKEISEVLFKISTHGEWSRKELSVVVSIDRLKRYLRDPDTEDDAEPQDFRASDFQTSDEFVENSGNVEHLHHPVQRVRVNVPADYEEISDLDRFLARNAASSDLSNQGGQSNSTPPNHDDMPIQHDEMVDEIRDVHRNEGHEEIPAATQREPSLSDSPMNTNAPAQGTARMRSPQSQSVPVRRSNRLMRLLADEPELTPPPPSKRRKLKNRKQKVRQHRQDDDMEEEEVGDGNEMAQLGFLFHQLCSVVETSLQ